MVLPDMVKGHTNMKEHIIKYTPQQNSVECADKSRKLHIGASGMLYHASSETAKITMGRNTAAMAL